MERAGRKNINSFFTDGWQPSAILDDSLLVPDSQNKMSHWWPSQNNCKLSLLLLPSFSTNETCKRHRHKYYYCRNCPKGFWSNRSSSKDISSYVKVACLSTLNIKEWTVTLTPKVKVHCTIFCSCIVQFRVWMRKQPDCIYWHFLFRWGLNFMGSNLA